MALHRTMIFKTGKQPCRLRGHESGVATSGEPPSWSEYVTRCEDRVQAREANTFSFDRAFGWCVTTRPARASEPALLWNQYTQHPLSRDQ